VVDGSLTNHDFQAIISWGDGSPDQVGSVGYLGGVLSVFSATQPDGTYHSYRDESQYAVGIRLERLGEPGDFRVWTTATISDLSLGGGNNLTVPVGVSLTNIEVAALSGNPSGGLGSDYTATIAWGDGGTSSGLVLGSGGTLWVAGSYYYANPGWYRGLFRLRAHRHFSTNQGKKVGSMGATLLSVEENWIKFKSGQVADSI